MSTMGSIYGDFQAAAGSVKVIAVSYFPRESILTPFLNNEIEGQKVKSSLEGYIREVNTGPHFLPANE